MKKTKQIEPVSDDSNVAEIIELYGICDHMGGHTSDDIQDYFMALADWTGLDLACLWDFDDDYGLGGNSEYAVVVRDKMGLFSAPDEIFEYLWAEGGTPDPYKLKGLKPGKYMKGSALYHEIKDYNWARRLVEGEAE